MLKSEGCKRASRSNMIPISNFSPLSCFIFFFFLFSLFVRSCCFHTREMHTRNKYRRTWKTHCIDIPLFGLMHDKLSHVRTYRHNERAQRRVNCNFSNCTLLSSVCNTFRDSWRTRCAKSTWFPSIEFYRRWKYWKHFRLLRTPYSFENSLLL